MTDLLPDTSTGELEALLGAAQAAGAHLRRSTPRQRASWLRAVADRLDAAGPELVEVAAEETHLGEARLVGELARTTFQLRLFGEVLEDGEWMGVVVDPPEQDWPPGARPDLRRMLVPLGPVLVFAASNFPFAFSVAGGDTASALAAGCPVILKAHPGHPRLSALTAGQVEGALGEAGAPSGCFSLVSGEEAARSALADYRIAAGAFTGSLRAGRKLWDLACSRPVPIPFYAEMGSLNPVFVTGGAIRRRREEILDGLAASFTMGAGQFCTKPGVVVVPGGDGFAADLAARVTDAAPSRLLNEHIATGYTEQLARLRSEGCVVTRLEGSSGDGRVTPTVLEVSVADLLAHREELLVECFGPATVVATCAGDEELLGAARGFDGQLTVTVQGEEDDEVAGALIEVLAERAGRVIWNGWPTGVSVTWAMNHGGPYPATSSPLHTSVGPAAIARFLRPVAYQSVPESLLPPALRDANPMGVPRRVDGRLEGGVQSGRR